MNTTIKYPLDLTGQSSDNLVQDEQHSLDTADVRAFAVKHGPFYTESVVVRDNATGNTLSKGEQYKPIHLIRAATMVSGKEVTSAIAILDETVSDNVSVDYQAVGGEYSVSVEAIEQLIDDAELDDRPVEWGMILGKPGQFPPAAHMHGLQDLYGFENVVEALAQLRQTILTGDRASHDEIYHHIGNIEQQLSDQVESAQNALTQHITNEGNPHNTSKVDVELGNVQNYQIATVAESKAGDRNDLYTTPLTVKEAILYQMRPIATSESDISPDTDGKVATPGYIEQRHQERYWDRPLCVVSRVDPLNLKQFSDSEGGGYAVEEEDEYTVTLYRYSVDYYTNLANLPSELFKGNVFVCDRLSGNGPNFVKSMVIEATPEGVDGPNTFTITKPTPGVSWADGVYYPREIKTSNDGIFGVGQVRNIQSLIRWRQGDFIANIPPHIRDLHNWGLYIGGAGAVIPGWWNDSGIGLAQKEGDGIGIAGESVSTWDSSGFVAMRCLAYDDRGAHDPGLLGFQLWGV